jgi:SAM-dependent methyltransferase
LAGVNLSLLQARWERLARTDALWAVLTDPAKKRGGWDRDAFFRTGESEIERVIAYVDCLSPGLLRGRALDFGCGVGRLSQALARHFGHVIGVDISPTMIELAKQYDRSEEPTSVITGEPIPLKMGRCDYLVNANEDLGLLADDSIDFVYSSITLQHVPAPAVESYLGEFIRVLRPGGLVLIQLPSYRVPTLKTKLSRFLPATLQRWRSGGMEMHGINRSHVISTLEGAGAHILDVLPDGSAPGWVGYRYAATK